MSRRWAIPFLFTITACILGGPSLAGAQGFHSVFSRDGVDAWAVGDGGVFYRSVDFGVSWSNGSLGPSTLRDVAARGFTVLVVGDSGKIWRSANSGGAWSLQVRAGTPQLMAIAMPTAAAAWIVGDGGSILHSADGGQTWSAQLSGTSQRLNAVCFVDALAGWAVGEGGVVLSTVDGGANWIPVAVPATGALTAVDQRGSRVWIVGERGVALASEDGGAGFSPVHLKLDSHSNVRAVSIAPSGTITLAGGGGFIRQSDDGGQTWTFPIHGMHGEIADLCVVGSSGFAVSSKNRVPMFSSDAGAHWSLPSGATVTRSWVLKLPFAGPGETRGSGFAWNPVHTGTIYCALGETVFRSQDEGETWASIATIPGSTKVNAFLVSPKDTNLFLAAVATPKKLVRSTDHGQTWSTTLTHAFGEFGIPLELDPDRPDTVYFGGDNDGLRRSTDFGATWQPWSSTSFRSPCDIVVIPDSGNVIVLGDGVTGSGRGKYFKSTNGGQSFTETDTRPMGTSEIPGLSNSRLRNSTVFGTNWGSGGVQKSTDFGETWPTIATTGSAWGTDIARDDPNVVIYGVYAGGTTYLSVDGGDTFATDPLIGSNYSFFLRDRGLVLAEQVGGIYKMVFTYGYTPQNGQTLAVWTPNGGETWPADEVRDITWSPTGVAVARIEYRRDPGSPWQLIAEVPGYYGAYGWTVANDPTTQAAVRVSDAWDGVPEDVSDQTFTITGTTVSVTQGPSTSSALWQNRPNPFTGQTRIVYRLAVACDVALEVFDLQGHRVATLARGRRQAGVHEAAFRLGSREPSRRGVAGVYFYRLRAGDFSATRKMLVLE